MAEVWYMTLRGKDRFSLIKKLEKTFAQEADQFEHEYEVITEGRRSVRWVEGYAHRLRPFFGEQSPAFDWFKVTAFPPLD